MVIVIETNLLMAFLVKVIPTMATSKKPVAEEAHVLKPKKPTSMGEVTLFSKDSWSAACCWTGVMPKY